MSADAQGMHSHASDVSVVQPQLKAPEVNVEYVRRVYASTREWYTVAEVKAQLLLAVNGVFVTILFGTLFGKTGDVRAGGAGLGPDTWIFLGVSVIALMTAVACAAMCLWSLHGGVGAEFARLGVNPDNPASYRPEVLWYFGHLANLKPDAAVEMLRRSDRTFEMDTLSYNVVDLAQKVLRKHRWVSAGWAFTALALIALVAAGVSFFVQARF